MRMTSRLAVLAAVVFGVGSAAFAADMPLKAPPAVAATVYSWTGFYIGAQGGYASGTSNQTFTNPAPGGTTGNYNISGGVGGVTVGFNWQADPRWVLGVEGDLSGGRINGSTGSSPTYGCAVICTSSVQWFDTFRGRAGYAFNNALIYGTGGLAYGRINTSFGTGFPGVVSNDRSGWTAGAGIEYGFAPHWSAKVEYLFVDFNTFTWTNAGGCAGLNCTTFDRFNVVRAGINYNFGGLR